MRTIWKFPFDIQDKVPLSMPQGAVLRHVGLDPAGLPCVWAEVDPAANHMTRYLSIVGTGHLLPVRPGEFLGTLMIGHLVFHVYDGGH